MRKRKKAIWITVSNDLKFDSERDLADIGAKIKIHQLNKFKYGKIETFKDGVLFLTYSGLIGESSMKSKNNTRLKQILQWCGPEFDGCVSLFLYNLECRVFSILYIFFVFSIPICKRSRRKLAAFSVHK